MTVLTFGCQGRDPTPTLDIKICPVCGHEVEVFSIDTSVNCDYCGQVVYNDKLDCVQWCKYAKMCVGEEEYAKLMEIAAMQKARAEEEAAAARAEKAREEALEQEPAAEDAAERNDA